MTIPRLLPLVLIAELLAAGCSGQRGTNQGGSDRDPPPPGTLTFTKDIAPILFDRCAICHRPQGAGPFELLTFRDVEQRAEQIRDVIESRYMPPWLPEPNTHRFLGERRLSDREIQYVKQWIEEGLAQGDPSDLPPMPTWPSGWTLGKPDLVVAMPEPYTRKAGNQDAWRNFVIPVPIKGTRYVRTIEFDPGNPQIVHHAIVQVDRTRGSRKLEAADPEPGFDGMLEGSLGLGKFAELPGGHYLGWTPGKYPYVGDETIAWRLDEGNDLILQLHMPATGKDEVVQSRIALYFSKTPPTRQAFSVVLSTRDVDIAPEVNDYLVEEEYTLPVDVDVLGLYPHAHYLCRDMVGLAELPQGKSETLFHIKDWDFDWQDEYRYEKPRQLPKGTKLAMRYRYDNSSENVRNPNDPPQRVVYGEQSTDEMGDLIVQILPRDPRDLPVLRNHYNKYQFGLSLARHKRAAAKDPNDVRAQNGVAEAYLLLGDTENALSHFQRVILLDPNHVFAHMNLSMILARKGQAKESLKHLAAAVRLEPKNAKIRQRYAMVLYDQGEVAEAISQLEHLVKLQPKQVAIRTLLGELLAKQRRFDAAIRHLQLALKLDPQHVPALVNLGVALRGQGKLDDAIRQFQKALLIEPQNSQARNELQNTLRYKSRRSGAR